MEDNPKSLASIYQQLTEPFAVEEIEIKPGATTKDKAKALALPYADIRVYQERLDNVAGPGNWGVEYRPISENAVFCRLTILGVVREDVGECHKTDRDGQPDENRTCTAVAQSFKRACSAFGIGRYLYSLPQIWAEYDGQKRQFVEVRRTVEDIYRRAGLLRGASRGAPAPERAPAEAPRPARPTPKPAPSHAAPPMEEAPSRPSREEMLISRLQKATDEAGLRAVGDEIIQARKQNDIDEAAQDRLKVIYKQQQQRLAKPQEPSAEPSRPAPRATPAKPQAAPSNPAPPNRSPKF